MRRDRLSRVWGSLLLLGACLIAHGEDTDIFASGFTSGATAPRILIVLDNTSNWARQSQQWPERNVCPDLSEWSDESSYDIDQCPLIGEQQGQAEVAALKAALADAKALAASNGFVPKIGLLEFTTDGNANQDGGYVRVHMSEFDTPQEALFNQTLEEIYDEINTPVEKRNSNTAYGNLMYDIYNYLEGDNQSMNGQGTPIGSDSNGNAYADGRAYSTPFSTFRSPLDDGDVCAETFVIFISNPNQSGPATDSTENSTALKALYASAGASAYALAGDSNGTALQMPEFIEVKGSGGGSQPVGFTTQCFERAQQCSQQINGLEGESAQITAACPLGGSCKCDGSVEDIVNALGEACPVDVEVRPNGKEQRTQYYSYEVRGPAPSEDGSYFLSGGTVDGIDFNMDDWTKYLQDYGVNFTVAGDDGDEDVNAKVTTYTIDVYNKAPDTKHSALMASAANVGGGYRLKAGDYAELKEALGKILSDILAVNSTFTAVSLPLSATNRTQAENKVFIAMFRPTPERLPRWSGNLKQYQLAFINGTLGLADENLNGAVDSTTGFVNACAESAWTESTSSFDIKDPNGDGTTESGGYFTYLDAFDPAPEGKCLSSQENIWSDLPDGSLVEKGGVAQQIRLYQHTLAQSDRNVFTVTDSVTPSILNLSPTASVDESLLGSNELGFLLGELPGLHGGDTLEDGSGNQTAPAANPQTMPEVGLAASVHGDVVHSSPLALTYGSDASGDTVFRVFYGGNDGLFRAIDPALGREDWAFIAPEHLPTITRLYENTPAVRYSNTDMSSLGVVDEPKPYFFDGNIGVYSEYDISGRLNRGYIFPTMRRGGRRVYALNVCDSCSGVPPSQPSIMWKAGCSADGVCSDGQGNNEAEMADFGQSWSKPVVVNVNGYSNPVLIMGGGWSTCLDNDVADLASACSVDSDLSGGDGEVGSAVFIFDAVTGQLLKKWDTETPVVADPVALDIAGGDNVADVVYALDAGGSLYRLAFVTASGDTLAPAVSADADGDGAPDAWSIAKVAGVSASSSRALRFYTKPALLPVNSEGKKYAAVAFGTGDREKPLRSNYPFADGVSYKFFTVLDRLFEWDVPNDGSALSLGLGDANRLIDLDDLAPATGNNDRNTYGLFNLSGGTTLTGTLKNYDGWVLTLGDAGEQIVNPPVIAAGQVFFNSYNPEGEAAACAPLGSSRGYNLKLLAPDAVTVSSYNPGFPIPPVVSIIKDVPCVGDECPDDGGTGLSTIYGVIGGDGSLDNPGRPPIGSQSTVKEVYRVENIDLQ